MKTFYKKLLETFEKESTKDLYRKNGLMPIQFVDIYAEQDLIPEWFEAHHYPALLVSWNINYQADVAVANITFHLCYEQLHDTSNLGTNTDLALKFLDFIEITDKVLKGIESPNTGKLYPPKLIISNVFLHWSPTNCLGLMYFYIGLAQSVCK